MASVPIAEIMAGNFSPDFCSTWTDCPRRNLQNYMKDENITNFQLCTTVRWKFQPFLYLATNHIESKDREDFRTLVESLVQMTTFISRIFLKLVELQKLIRLFCWNYAFYIITFQKIRQIKALIRLFCWNRHLKLQLNQFKENSWNEGGHLY